MAVEFEHLNVVWLKRDLRLRDHEPLYRAAQNGAPVLLLYIVEPNMLQDPHMDIRHWRFIWQSLQDMNSQLRQFDCSVKVLAGDAVEVFQQLQTTTQKLSIFSYQEIGLLHTFERDKALKAWCSESNTDWQEANYGAVSRALSERSHWQKLWYQRMRANTFDVDLEKVSWVKDSQLEPYDLPIYKTPDSWQESVEGFQLGGERRAWHALHHFFAERGKDYHWAISKPEASRKACSRLSPYLAWGNMSIKQMYQTLLQHWNRKGWRRALAALSSRLHWHCHFIQKFESEHRMEFHPVNRAYEDFPYLTNELALPLLQRWQAGTTGIPLVDACMRCVVSTGYLNFRMRAMLVSFLVHHLNVDWRMGVVFLGRQFLDFEPGIHYPQFQMQAGVTGINLIRIYNPVKQAQDHDSDAVFIKKWCPELQPLPAEFAIQPWLMSLLEQQMYQVHLGRDYPEPIVDISASGKQARELLWGFRKKTEVKAEAERILARHTVPQTRHKYRRG